MNVAITLNFKLLSFNIYFWSAGRYLFCELYLPWHSVHHSLLPVQKCNTCMNFQISVHWTASNIYFKIWSSESTRKSAGYGWFEAESDWCMSWSGTERYWRRHWSVVQISPCLHSIHRRTFLIFIVIQISQNVTNCNRL